MRLLVLSTSLAIVAVLLLGSFVAYGQIADQSAPLGAPRAPWNTPESSAATTQTEQAPVAVPEPTDKAMQRYRSGIMLWVVNIVWGLLVPLLFLFTGLSARIRNLAVHLGRRWFFIIAVYFIIFTLLNFVIGFPLAYYEEFVREHAYGLSNQTFGRWSGDAVKATLVGIVIGCLFLWVPYLLLKRSPQRWWLYTSLLAVPFIFLLLLVTPVWIEPLFDDFKAMKNKALEARILRLAERSGIEGSRVYEVNKSEDTKTVNAYVTGFAGTKRIVLWDTLTEKLTEDEVLSVMGHEMGHYVLGHVIKTVLFVSVLIVVALYGAHRLAGWMINRFGARFGFTELSDIASLPLLLLLVSIISLVTNPIALAYSRHNEHEADRFGLEITRNNRAAATAFVKLQTENLSNPRPGTLVKVLRASHPPIGERIDFCNTYRPWATGEPLKYAHLFKNSEEH